MNLHAHALLQLPDGRTALPTEDALEVFRYPDEQDPAARPEVGELHSANEFVPAAAAQFLHQAVVVTVSFDMFLPEPLDVLAS